MTEPDLSNLKRDAKGNILRSELLRINKPVLRQLRFLPSSITMQSPLPARALEQEEHLACPRQKSQP